MNRRNEQSSAGQTGRQSIGQAIVYWLRPVAAVVGIISGVVTIWQQM
ncbi:hypothetical protein [Streptomyces sp. NPDC020817]